MADASQVRVEKFLLGQSFPCDVDSTEPIKPFLVRSLADIDKNLIVEDLCLLGVGEIVEILRVPVLVSDGEITIDELAERNRPLLPVQDLESPILVLAPIHYIEG